MKFDSNLKCSLRFNFLIADFFGSFKGERKKTKIEKNHE